MREANGKKDSQGNPSQQHDDDIYIYIYIYIVLKKKQAADIKNFSRQLMAIDVVFDNLGQFMTT